jgi:hypothetical protein
MKKLLQVARLTIHRETLAQLDLDGPRAARVGAAIQNPTAIGPGCSATSCTRNCFDCLT